MEWKQISDIQGYEEFTNFELNIQGELRNIKNGKLRKWSPDKDGYYQTNLRQAPAKLKHITQHRAICCLFLPNPLNLPQVDHKDRDPSNNNIENLRWATRIEQMHNRGMVSTNTSGEEHIQPTFNHDKPIWLIRMRFKGSSTTKTFKRDPTSDEIPQEVIDFRDAMKLEIEAELENERNN